MGLFMAAYFQNHQKLFKNLRIQPEYFVSSSKSKNGKELILNDILSESIN